MNLKDVGKIMDSYPFELSGGMLQRVMIAMVIALEPKLIIADEPTSALDVINQKRIIDELMMLKTDYNTSMIFITHDISIAAYVSDYIIVMKSGKIVEMDSKENLILRPKHQYTRQLLSNIVELEDL